MWGKNEVGHPSSYSPQGGECMCVVYSKVDPLAMFCCHGFSPLVPSGKVHCKSILSCSVLSDQPRPLMKHFYLDGKGFINRAQIGLKIIKTMRIIRSDFNQITQLIELRALSLSTQMRRYIFGDQPMPWCI